MKYHLEKFDSSVNDNTVQGLEVKEIIDEIKQSAFSVRSEHELKLFIQNHQKTLLKFKSHQPIEVMADEILYFLETQFTSAINDELPVSNLAIQEFWAKHSETVLYFRPKIKYAINEKLYKCIQVLVEPENASKLSIYNLKYLDSFWSNWPMDHESHIDRENIMLYLISQNFNESCYFRYITRGIIAELAKEDSPYFQKQILLGYKQKLGTVFPKLNLPFCLYNTAIQPSLASWLESQLEHCSLMSQNVNQTLASSYKIETSLSVSQTAYLFKLLYQSGIITNKAQTDMLHAVSERFSTQNSSNISYESLYNKYYNVEDRTKEYIQEVVKTLLKNIKTIH